MQLTTTQFDALAKLIRMGDTASCRAARSILVDGVGPTAAGEMHGITQAAASKAAIRVTAAMELAKIATAA